MKLKNLILLLVLSSTICYAQTKVLNPDDILVGDRKLPTVLLVGTFHFAYFNLDIVKTPKDKQIDILSAKKQAEVEELVDYISKFKPTKIIIESHPENLFWMNKYTEFKNSRRSLGKNEIEQIGFRLARRFNLDSLYGADAYSIFMELYYSKDSTVLRPTLDYIFSGWGDKYKYRCNDPVCKLNDSLHKYSSELCLKLPLLDYFRFYNSDKALNRNYGSYFDGEYFTQGQYRGADAVAMDWYDRNLRIFRNIQRLTTSPDDRIIVIFGQGHISILKHLFECAPNYKLVKFDELTNMH